ncbi:unnamed protein product [Rhizophagus irregularis]|uniref:Reverse transcriptase domain-containing protein n=1 Tax=Rhizophagus irregularis TaxID=588596 RepID=A0A916EHS6_9GLOM|nr:unnamed protein product [Rhizophagus irregularis]
METQECINIYENIFRPKSITFPGCAYMDDTGFITNNKLNLERILKIADSFYKLNDIKINKQKSELLLRKNVNKKNPLDKKVNINFGQETIEIEPTPCNQSSRFLGVWINAYNNNKHIEQQIKNEIRTIIKNLSSKKELLVENNFSSLRNNTILSEYSIEGGPTVLRNILSKEVYIKNFKFFKDNNIIFLGQITTLDKKHILSIEELETRSYVKLNRKKKLQKNTKFYQKLLKK